MQFSQARASQKGFAAYVAILAVVAVFISIASILLLKNPPVPANLYQAVIVSEAPQANIFKQAIGNNANGNGTNIVKLNFPANDTAGDLIIVAVTWGNSAIDVSSITDVEGNVYTNATGKTRFGAGWNYANQLYYAKNIAGGDNLITITMSGVPTGYLQASAYEYSGLDPVSPLDAVKSATGTNATAAPVAGTGFTGRLVTNAGWVLGEDKTVSVTSTYKATETSDVTVLNSTSKVTKYPSELIFGLGQRASNGDDWVMNMATFKLTPAPTPTPTPVPTPTPTPTPSVTPTPTPVPTPTPTPTALTVTTNSLPNGIVNVAYSVTLQASGGATPYTWSISGGTLPAGLTLTGSTGVIAGTPTTQGTSNFTVKVTDKNGATATKALSIVVNPAGSCVNDSHVAPWTYCARNDLCETGTEPGCSGKGLSFLGRNSTDGNGVYTPLDTAPNIGGLTGLNKCINRPRLPLQNMPGDGLFTRHGLQRGGWGGKLLGFGRLCISHERLRRLFAPVLLLGRQQHGIHHIRHPRSGDRGRCHPFCGTRRVFYHHPERHV